jgi:hypothetical protein
MLEGLEKALEIVNRRLDYLKSANKISKKAGYPISHGCRYVDSYIYAFEEMKIYLEGAAERVKNGEGPDSTSIVMENNNEQ